MDKLIIFDMDGTIIKSDKIIADSINYVRNKLGLKPLDKDYMLEKVNEENISVSEFCYNSKSFTKQHSDLFDEYFTKHYKNDISLYDGIRQLLINLEENHILAIATNAYSSTAKMMLKHLKIEHYFSNIIGSDMTKLPKPNKEMLEIIIHKNKIKKENTIFIGDSEKDKKTSQNANIKFILVPWGFSTHKHTDINNTKDLERVILNLFN